MTQLRKNVNEIDNYNVFRYHNDGEDILVKGIPYIFFTTPKLNLDERNISRSNFLTYLKFNEPEILKTLTSEDNPNFSPFIKLLTNRFETFETKDVSFRTKETAETCSGFKMAYPTSIVDSINADTLTIKYLERKDMKIINLHKAWMEYVENIRWGVFAPKQSTLKQRFIDYFSSIYYFLLDFDGETILYYAKYTGLVPISMPYSAFSVDAGQHEQVDATFQYLYNYKEDLDPAILMDFNKVATLTDVGYTAKATNKGYIPYFNPYAYSADYYEKNIEKSKVFVIKTDYYETLDNGSGKFSFKLKFS